jgi:Flp pilus assembly protein TadG
MDTRHDPRAERGQVLVIFTLALVSIVAMTGLVIDGGDTFVQRRDMQNVADAAAMAAGYSYGNTSNASTAQAAGLANAAANGYSNSGPTAVTVQVTPKTNGSVVVATVSRPHRNWFAGILGMGSWQVSTTATVVTGEPNGVYGLMPIIVNEAALDSYNFTNQPPTVVTFSEPPSGSGDIPQDQYTFNWTNYCTASGSSCNADSTSVNQLITSGGVQVQVSLSDNINPLNAGSHATLYSSLYADIGTEFPIAIVDSSGALEGWAIFHLTGSVGGSTKQISGYFTPANNDQLTLNQDLPGPTLWTGAYVVKLSN